MNILYGLYKPDEGEIAIEGRPVVMHSPKDAIEQGVGMVHQHFMLIPVMTVAENIVLATEPRTAGVLLDFGAAEARVRDLSQRFGLAVDPRSRIESITVGQQQRVEILKALYRGADILVLDEPTAVLTPQEAKELFAIVHSLTEQGKSIVFITHKLNEVLEIADRITVLRRGKKVETLQAAGATEEGLARLMVGREVLLARGQDRCEAGRAAPGGGGPPRVRRPRHREGARRVVRGSRRRDRRHRRHRRQRADGAHRLAQRPDTRRGGFGAARRPRRDEVVGQDALPLGPRPRARGPAATRAGARVLALREHGAPRLPRQALLVGGLALPAPPRRAGAPA